MLLESSKLSSLHLLTFSVSAGELLDDKSFASAPPDLFLFSGFCMDRSDFIAFY